MRNIRNQRLVKKRHLLRGRHLKSLGPLGQCLSLYRRILPASALQSLKKNIHRRSQRMQLDSGAKSAGSQAQPIPLGPRPRTPFDDDSEAQCEEILCELPLQRLDLLANIFAIEVNGQCVQPLIWRKANRSESAFQRPRKRGLP